MVSHESDFLVSSESMGSKGMPASTAGIGMNKMNLTDVMTRTRDRTFPGISLTLALGVAVLAVVLMSTRPRQGSGSGRSRLAKAVESSRD
jgi:hypothetical protein